MLRIAQREMTERTRGRLKIFLGMSAGVGKTYAMLSEAHEQIARGIDLVVGYAETHGRKETEALLVGLPSLPLREVEHRGILLKEFDIDEALRRRPRLLVVDELPHTNAPGSRHLKRYQDVEELLAAGIDVHTAINIQHVESLRDVVASMTGVFVQETVPDTFIDAADEIELVDIPPDELRQRVQEGKVYVPAQTERALEGFFCRGNLLALRELALRRAADRVDAEIQSFRRADASPGSMGSRQRILVCVAPNRLGERVIRAAARYGTAMHAQVLAISVISDRQTNRSDEDRDRAERAMRLAEALGMETLSRSGHDIVAEILTVARQRGAGLIIVGKPIRSRWHELVRGSVVDDLVRRSGDIDVHVITGESETPSERPTPIQVADARPEEYAASVLAVAATTALCFLLSPWVHLSNLIMLYLLAVGLVSTRVGRGPSLLSAILSVAAFDFFFVSPRYTFAVSDVEFLPTFVVMFAVSVILSGLNSRFRRQAADAASRERRTSALYEVSRDMAASRTKQEIAEAAARRIGDEFDTDVAVLLPDARSMLTVVVPSVTSFEADDSEMAVAQWAFEHGKPAGAGTDTLPGSAAMYLPLRASRGSVGALALSPRSKSEALTLAQRTLLETFATGLAVALERTLLAKESHEARLQAESEKMRNALLSSISHDLRTPLTAIAGAASAMRERGGAEQELAETIYEESMRLNLQVQNLLDMTRLNSGEIRPNVEWQSLEELIAAALDRTRVVLSDRPVEIHIPSDLPLLELDGALMEKVFANLFENAAVHAQGNSPIEVSAWAGDETVYVEVSDRGPGIPVGSEATIFERFQRPKRDGDGGRFGLGLAICRAIVRLHGGRIWAKNRTGGGSTFVIELPKPDRAPEVPVG
ncbi:osmosensitive K+ channel signal transduction histidine kinase [Fimbriimonas ginsengisoli Gsoil 348]|uniref:histidine kinase n=1 Tax=Fimbriimonas ginsengisoli Gsoil 348 TaxID=661478 RepID=A0A068NN19_FIMGI|nr:osmosensitive K+ channel signal transduction histidine kinase [Fimbriimonas ginsengisoli Gsoil 348]